MHVKYLIDMEQKEEHFTKIFRFVILAFLMIMVYIFGVTFLPIPKDNAQYAHSALGFLLGVLSSVVVYLVGGNPSTNKKTDIATGTTGTTIINNSEPINKD